MTAWRVGFGGIAAALAMMVLSGCATTEASDNAIMAQCDGFSSRVRSTPNMRGGVVTCSKALAALDASSPENWTRRVSLLHARALHHLESKNVAAALADLDAADTAAKVNDIYYQRSLGLNGNLIRSLAFYLDDRKADARELALRAAASRPYNRDTALAALSIVASGDDREVADKLALTAVRVHPTMALMAFRLFFETGRYEQALAIADQPRRPLLQRNFTWRNQILSDELERKKEVLFKLDLEGRKAFALAALNREAEARSVLNAMPAWVAAAKVKPISLPSKPSEEQQARNLFQGQVNDEIDVETVPLVDFWSRLTRARLALNAGDKDAAARLVSGIKPVSPTLVLAGLVPDDPAAALLLTDDTLRVAATGVPPATPKAMFGLLQNLETRDGVVQAIDPVSGLFMSEDDRERGPCSEGKLTNGLEKVCFVTLKSSPNVAEERAVLRAADKAIERGASSFVIESRSDAHTTIVTTHYGMTTGSYDGDYQSNLIVRFFKPDDPSAKCFRCLDAANVQANLGPIYRPAASKP